uniref:Protein transport protein Sec31A n=1 Tax=Salarias fasciatus TaxID=181472 RepID=A0A672J766_SALFA
MRLKEIQRTAHQAWSPAGHHPICLALGTSAQQLDASFNTTAAIEIFEMDFSDPSLDIKHFSLSSVSHRLHSIVWVNFGMGADGTGGRLVAGSENGALTVYNPEAIMNSAADTVVGQSDKHTGPVRALDFNPFQSNLLASGANDSEIYIWDLNNFSSPMTPGAKTQPAEDISVVSWNRQVQHILASANPSGKAVVWDLRKNEPIIKISDHSNRMHCSGMLWHPDVATQLVLASEDDRLPVIQMWDLRFATSPLKVLENHTRGILSISWSQADSELLLSSAKDNRILCWNPNTGEVIYELPTTNQWCFDVQWCPRNPALLSAASFDGRITVYSVMGGSLKAQQQSTADKISSSFDTMDPFGTGQVLPPLQVPQPKAQDTIIPPLKKPPKWIRRPVGASFAFGGKLITFENPKLPPVQSPQPVPRQVVVSQVTTETEFLQRSRELQAALQSGSFNNYCQAKIQGAKSDAEQDIWKFLLVNFEDEARVKFLRLLGFNTDGLISQALLVGNFEGAVDLCLNDGRYAEAILLSISGGEELLKKTQQKYLSKQKNSISMLISSVVTQNWRDIVQSCELDNWKEALAALLTYAHPEEFAHLCDTLGSRLECEGTEKRCLQACLCYICSGNIEKLVECWALHRDCNSPLGLEDLVEKVMMLRKSIERLQKTKHDFITQNRLFHAQGEAAIGQHPANSFNSGAGSAAKPAAAAAAAQIPAPKVRQLAPCPSNLPRSCRAVLQLFVSFPPGFLPHQPFQPQPMSAGGPLAYSPPGPSMPAANLSGPQPPPPPSSSTPGGVPPMPSPGLPPTGLMPSTSVPSGLMPPSSQPGAPVPMYPGALHGQGPAPLMAAGSFAPLGAGYPQGGPGAPAAKPFSAPVGPPPTGPQEGWNDPPAVRGVPRKKKVPDNYTPPAPITAPVMGFPVEAPQPHGHAQVPPGAPQEPTVQVGPQPGAVCRDPHRQRQTCDDGFAPQLLQQLPAERVEQKEIPAEHMVLKSTFDSLVQRCQLAAGDPQTKRKLDDAAKRLGHLYDKLREQSLSHNILNGLHEISRCVASQNYQRGLEVHTQVVSSSNFSEISAFMPILKVVMTIANKLGV